MEVIDSIFYILILVMSIVAHEVAHGYAALYFGDTTAKHAGRLTLNPIKHLDWFGSVLLPAILVLTKAPFLIGWAKPVPYNPDNLSNRKWGTFAVASAGIATNFLIAIVFSVIFRIGAFYGAPESFFEITSTIVLMNLALMLFNLVPIPPLDGSKILFAFLPFRLRHWQENMERFSLVLFLIFIFYFSKVLAIPLSFLFSLLIGIGV